MPKITITKWTPTEKAMSAISSALNTLEDLLEQPSLRRHSIEREVANLRQGYEKLRVALVEREENPGLNKSKNKLLR